MNSSIRIILILASCILSQPVGIINIVTDWDIPPGACTAIPRNKIWIDTSNPLHMVLCHGRNDGETAVWETMDGGSVWNSFGAEVLDYHTNLAGDESGRIFLGSRDGDWGLARYRRYNGSNWEPWIYFDDYGGDAGTAHVIVGKGSDVWVFVRDSHGGTHYPSRIYYHRSTDYGETFGGAVPIVDATDGVWKRIGSCIIEGEPSLLLWEIEGDHTNYKIFRWEGSGFESISNNTLQSISNDPLCRMWAIVQGEDGFIHAVYRDYINSTYVLRHSYRMYLGNWSSSETIQTLSEALDGEVAIGYCGDRVYVSYICTVGTRQVYYKTWTYGVGWSEATRVSEPAEGVVGNCNTAQIIHGKYLPIIWDQGSPRTIKFKSIFIGSTSKVDDFKGNIIDKFLLEQNYPNPFNSYTDIKVILKESIEVKLKIFNIMGENITSLVSKKLYAGDHIYRWNAEKFPSGIYLCSLEVDDHRMIRKMVLLR